MPFKLDDEIGKKSSNFPHIILNCASIQTNHKTNNVVFTRDSDFSKRAKTYPGVSQISTDYQVEAIENFLLVINPALYGQYINA